MACDVALIGFGEAGSTFARAAGWGARAQAFDPSPQARGTMAGLDVTKGATAAEALIGAPLVLSLVTADQAMAVAQACAAHLAPGALWCDMNSVAPQTKREAAQAIEVAGRRYIDVAILAPVNPAGLGVPLLVSGPSAAEGAAALNALGFTNVSIAGDTVGMASSIKMIRSVMIKGIEALTAEMMLAAEAAGVSCEVLASLDASEKPLPWREKARYNLERMAVHGMRRAAEMEEAARTLVALGVEPILTAGTVRRQREAGLRSKGSEA